MKTLICTSILTFAALPAAAWAQVGDTGTVAIDGRVAPLCILGDPAPAQVDLGLIAATAGTRAGRIAVLPPRAVTLPASFCNFAGSVVRIDASALLATDSSSPQPGFARAVNFTAAATGWASGSALAATAALGNGTAPTGSGTSTIQPLPQIADIAVTLSDFTVPGDHLLVAGTYQGLVVVTLGAAAVE
jgi:hypothetical protein